MACIMEANGLLHLEEIHTFDPHRRTRARTHGSLSLSGTICIFLFGSFLTLKTQAMRTLFTDDVSPEEDAANLASRHASCPIVDLSELTGFCKTSMSSVF